MYREEIELDIITRILFIIAPVVMAYALTMSFFYQDIIAYIISLVGSFTIMFIIGKANV